MKTVIEIVKEIKHGHKIDYGNKTRTHRNKKR